MPMPPNLPKQSTNWEQNIQMYECMGAILTQTSTNTLIHLRKSVPSAEVQSLNLLKPLGRATTETPVLHPLTASAHSTEDPYFSSFT